MKISELAYITGIFVDLVADGTDASVGPSLFLVEEDALFTPSLNLLVLHTPA